MGTDDLLNSADDRLSNALTHVDQVIAQAARMRKHLVAARGTCADEQARHARSAQTGCDMASAAVEDARQSLRLAIWTLEHPHR